MDFLEERMKGPLHLEMVANSKVSPNSCYYLGLMLSSKSPNASSMPWLVVVDLLDASKIS